MDALTKRPECIENNDDNIIEEALLHQTIYIGIFLNFNNDYDEDYKNIQQEFLQYVDELRTFDDIEHCCSYMNVNKAFHFIIISSYTLSEKLISCRNKLPQFISIFILCKNHSLHTEWAIQNASKINGLFDNKYELFQHISYRIQQLNFSSILILDKKNSSQTSLRQLNTKDDKLIIAGIPSKIGLTQFFWYQLFIYFLLRLNDYDDARKEMLHICRQYYKDNQTILKEIVKFDKSYTSDFAAKWYSKPTFVYRMINTAIRTQNINSLILFRFFIIDLHKQLKNLHKKYLTDLSDHTIITVYRGQSLKRNEFDTLNINSYVSFNGFLSTTINEGIARLFIENSSNELVAVLWEIKINTKHTRTIFADISSLSNITAESEILFTIGSLFKIENITKNFDKLLCKITLTTIDDENTCDSFVHDELIIIQEALRGQLPMLQLSSVLISMGEFDIALRLNRRMEKKLLTNDSQLGHIFNNYGLIYAEQCNFSAASYMHYIARQIFENEMNQCLNNSLDYLTSFFNMLYSIYNRAKGLLAAQSISDNELVKFLTKPIVKGEKLWQRDCRRYGSIMANAYLTLGSIYLSMKAFDAAYDQYTQAFRIFGEMKSTFGFAKTMCARGEYFFRAGGTICTDPDLPEGNVGFACELYTLALLFLRELLSPNDPTLVHIYENLGLVNFELGHFSEALILFEKVLAMIEIHPYKSSDRLTLIHIKLARTHTELNNDEKALEHWLKAYHETLQLIDVDLDRYQVHLLSRICEFIGFIYSKINNEEQMMHYLREHVKYNEKHIPNIIPGSRAEISILTRMKPPYRLSRYVFLEKINNDHLIQIADQSQPEFFVGPPTVLGGILTMKSTGRVSEQDD